MAEEPKLSFKIDWLSFTIAEEKDGRDVPSNFKILKKLGYNVADFEPCTGRYFFNSGMTLENYVNVFYNDSALEKGKYSVDRHCYVFSGVGTTSLASKIDNNWLKLFRSLKAWGCKITRLDVALDDFSGVLNYDVMENKLKRGEFRSSKKSYQVLKQTSTAGKTMGRTIYVGSREKTGKKGNFFIRFYDKKAEYEGKNQILPAVAQLSGVWQRYEIQFNKEKARAMVDLILEKDSIGEAYYGIMLDTIAFLVKTKNKKGQVYKNKSKWKVCEWWKKFIQDTKQAKLREVSEDYSLGTILRWLRIAVVPSLSMLDTIFENQGYDLYKILSELGVEDYSKKQWNLLYECSHMQAEDFKPYLKQFIEGDYTGWSKDE